MPDGKVGFLLGSLGKLVCLEGKYNIESQMRKLRKMAQIFSKEYYGKE